MERHTGTDSQPHNRYEEFTAAQKFFAKGLMRVSGTNSVEEARAADWRFDGLYSARNRDPESTNYQVITKKTIPEKGEETVTVSKEEDDTARRCTICHQPIIYVNLIGVGGQVVPTGSDCTAKLLRFKETGQIVAENPKKEIWDEQSDILLEGAEYEKDVMEQSGEKRITKRKIIASMMSWLTDHMNDEGTPENVQYAIRSYNSVGLLPSKELARELSDYYKSVRKFLPGEVLKDEDAEGLEYHPHQVWLEKIVGKGVVQENIPQLKRIIEKGRKLVEAQYQRQYEERQERYNKWAKEQEQARIKKDQEYLKKKQANSEIERKRKSSEDAIERAYKKGIISKHKFSIINFADDICLAENAEGKKGLTRAFEENKTLRYYEIDENNIVNVYELDQAPVYGYGNASKHFVIIGQGKLEKIKLYPKSMVEEVAKKVNKKEISYEKEEVSTTAEELAPEATIKRYSCAQVVISNVTNEPVVLLADGPKSLGEVLKEYEVRDTI
ncbi:MAG: hypothetical protein Q7R65_01415 [bacterium]|nr:hypothetical protein [bacterium]